MKGETKSFDVKKLVETGLLMAIVTTLTLIVIPVPITNGYVNLGDAAVYLTVSAMGGAWGVVAAGVGSMLADLILGYGIYAPATLIIKSLAALVCLLLMKKLKNGWRILAMFISGTVVVGGYYLFEALFVSGSFTAAAVNIVPNVIQACVGAVAGYVLAGIADRVFKKSIS